jgi:hypothetical protein
MMMEKRLLASEGQWLTGEGALKRDIVNCKAPFALPVHATTASVARMPQQPRERRDAAWQSCE